MHEEVCPRGGEHVYTVFRTFRQYTPESVGLECVRDMVTYDMGTRSIKAVSIVVQFSSEHSQVAF